MEHQGPFKPLRRKRLWLAVGWFLVALVIVLSLAPVPPESPVVKVNDKLLHVAAYLGLMLWFCAIYQAGTYRRRIAAMLVLIGVLLEIAQGATGHRSLQGLDMTANGLGVILGWLAARTRLSDALVFVESRLPGNT
ncbi:MAG: VanZ family protein [Thermodesulfobacteriota bacterium]